MHNQKPKLSRLKKVSYTLLGLTAVWILGDWMYSSYVSARGRAWEKTIRRNADGVQQGCAAYTIGYGKDALLLVHGINDSPRCFHKLAPALSKQGYTCRVMRLPGFGEPLQQYARAERQQWRTAVEKEAQLLRTRHARVFAVAHSLGAAVTIAATLDQPDLFDGVVLLAPAIEVSNQRSPLLPTRWWHALGRRVLFFTRVTYSPFAGACLDPQERDYPGRMVFTPLSVVEQTFAVLSHNRGRAAEFQTPLLMVLSKRDRVIDWQAAQRFYEQAASQPKQILFLQNSDHMIPVDYGWQDVCEAIVGFIE